MSNEWLTLENGNLKGFTFTLIGNPENRIVMQRGTEKLYRLDYNAIGQLIKTPVKTSEYLLGVGA